MTDPIGVALVGYGLAGRTFHAPLIAATPGMTLRLVISGDAAKVRADLGPIAVAGDLDAALADPAVDLVVIATPDMLHAPQALAAIAAGKHVLIDKPFAPTLAEAEAVAAAAGAAGRLLAVFHNRRHDADFLTLRRLIADGALGEIVQFESHFDRFRPAVVDRWKERPGAGVWQDLGPHLVDQALMLFGMPDAVLADIGAQKTGARAPDYAHVLLRYGRLRVILHAAQTIHACGLRFAVHGTNGSYVKHGLDPQEGQSKAGLRPGDVAWGRDPRPGVLTRIGDDGTASDTVVASERGDYPAFYAGLRDAIRDRAPNPVPPEQALAVMRVLEAARRSAAERREIALGAPARPQYSFL